MDRKIRVAAIGDNCIDYYDSLNESYPGGNPVNVAVYIKRLGGVLIQVLLELIHSEKS